MEKIKNDGMAYHINRNIQICKKHHNDFDVNNISDGYHTFGELYKHRIHLFIALCKQLEKINLLTGIHINDIIKSKKHFDGSEYEGWFIIQITKGGEQISYHLPNEYWDETDFIDELDRANEWDGHDSDAVLERLLII